ncbi:MAG: hypothetical protein DMD77_04560 [Candidatus Rokuibacteriota bacterium]|nr:MAG: hypothetical protein DMD77_04560 [Candidatus Rokubacteria bacterium]
MASRRQDPEITVAVDGASWTRVQSLRRAGPDDQVFTVSTEDDGTTEVRFGDGSRGLRPPAGSTLTVTYKTGGGAIGNVSRVVEDARLEPRFWLIERDGSGAVGWETLDRPRRRKLFASAATLLGMALAAASIFGLNRDRPSR